MCGWPGCERGAGNGFGRLDPAADPWPAAILQGSANRPRGPSNSSGKVSKVTQVVGGEI